MADTHVPFPEMAPPSGGAVASAPEARTFESSVRDASAGKASAGGTLPSNGQALSRPSGAGRGAAYSRYLLVAAPIAITALVVGALLLFLASWIQVAIVGIPVALILYVVASQLHTRLLRPLTDLSEQTRRLAHGDLSHMVVLPGSGIGSELAADVNYLVRGLRAAREHERTIQEGLARATAERAATDELRLSYDNLIVVSELGQQIIASLRLEDIARAAYE